MEEQSGEKLNDVTVQSLSYTWSPCQCKWSTAVYISLPCASTRTMSGSCTLLQPEAMLMSVAHIAMEIHAVVHVLCWLPEAMLMSVACAVEEAVLMPLVCTVSDDKVHFRLLSTNPSKPTLSFLSPEIHVLFFFFKEPTTSYLYCLYTP